VKTGEPADEPFLSVIVPCLNEAHRIGGLVAKLVGAGREILVVDGQSEDGTAAVAAAAGARVIQTGRGRGRQLHAGAQAALGRRLWFLHADSGVEPAHLIALDAAPGPWGCFEVHIEGGDPRLRFTTRWMNGRARRGGSCTGDMGIWADRAFYWSVGGFPELSACEDLAFTDAARRQAAPSVLSPALGVSDRRWQGQGVNRTILRMWAVRSAYRLGLPPRVWERWWRTSTDTQAKT
jgi:rSAM/selenodomain-associated transferase 2